MTTCSDLGPPYRSINKLLKVSLCLVMFVQAIFAQCPMTGCNNCSTVNGSTVCSQCSDGYYQGIVQKVCYPCQSKCTTCTYSDNCQSCKDGFYLDTSQNFCISCADKCTKCTEASTCTECEEGHSLNNEKLCATTEAASSGKSSSLVGQIIGYCVSGVLLIVCCVITLLHQKRKQEEEEEARKKFKEEQARLERTNRPDGNRDSDVVEDLEFDRLHNNRNSSDNLLGSAVLIKKDVTTSGSSSRLQPGNDPKRLDSQSLLLDPLQPNGNHGGKGTRKDLQTMNSSHNSGISPTPLLSQNGNSIGVFTRAKKHKDAPKEAS